MEKIVKVKSTGWFTHDVLRMTTEKPLGFQFIPGQAVDMAINKNGWKGEKRCFSFISLSGDDYLEFAIKTYPEHKGVTNQLRSIKKDDELILYDAFGDIAYHGEGVFIAGGAGVTPFIGILRELRLRNELGANRLIFANKTTADIILKEEFGEMLGDKFINILSQERAEGCAYGLITEQFLKDNLGGLPRHVYLCGPPPMMHAVEAHLGRLDFDKNSIVKEGF